MKDLTRQCIVSGKKGFEEGFEVKFAILEVEGKAYDKIRINKVNGLKFKELLAVSEYPKHEDHPIIDNSKIQVLLGGENKKSKRTLCLIGK